MEVVAHHKVQIRKNLGMPGRRRDLGRQPAEGLRSCTWCTY